MSTDDTATLSTTLSAVELEEEQIDAEAGQPEQPTDIAASVDDVQLRGYLDALEENRIHGWIWNPDDPSERLIIDVIDAGEGVTLATGVADQLRKDLLASQIGDGCYAFCIDLEGVIGLRDTGRLRVVARRLHGGQRMDLLVPENPVPAALPPAFQEPAERPVVLEAEVVVQELRDRDRRLWGGLRQLAQVTQAKPKELSDATRQITATAQTIEQTLKEFTAQNGGFDTVLLRVEKALAQMEARVQVLEKAPSSMNTTALLTWAIIATLAALFLAAMMIIVR